MNDLSRHSAGSDNLIMSTGKPVHSLFVNICNGIRAEVEPGHDKGARGEPSAGNRLGGEGMCRSVHCSAYPKYVVDSTSCKSVQTCFALYTAADLLAMLSMFHLTLEPCLPSTRSGRLRRTALRLPFLLYRVFCICLFVAYGAEWYLMLHTT